MTGIKSLGGKILRVNLSLGKISTEPTEEYVEKTLGAPYFLGGKQVNTWMLYREVKPWVTPLEPANKLILGVGSLVGTLAPTASRLSVESKNAFTNGYASSNLGSHFTSELKYAGYDHVILEGRSSEPVYLWIDDESVELRGAGDVWGRLVTDSDNAIKEEVGDSDIQTLLIGPAGENMVRSACILAERVRAAGRCGLGAVMGSKQLKGVAVRGTGSVEVADPEGFMEVVDRCYEKVGRSPFVEHVGKYGTGGLLAPPLSGPFAYRNYQDEQWTPKCSEEDYEFVEEGTMACFACPIHCSHFYRIKGGAYDGVACEGMEGNIPINFGSTFDVSYKPSYLKGHSLVSELGLDQDNATRVIAWATECFQRGIIDESDTGGVKLQWGDHEQVMDMLTKLAYRQGFGDVLAEGCVRASSIIGRGSERYCIHVKGQELFESMRTLKGWALGVGVAARGGGHTTGSVHTGRHALPEELCDRLWGAPRAGDRLAYEDKPKVVAYMERLTAACSSLGICIFASARNDPVNLMSHDDLADLFSAATGLKMTGKKLLLVGERVRSVEKAFNVLHTGFSRRDDYPPQRLMDEPIKTGPYKGERLHRDRWSQMLDEYYGLHGWNPENSWPTRASLESIGLGEVADDLEKAERLG